MFSWGFSQSARALGITRLLALLGVIIHSCYVFSGNTMYMLPYVFGVLYGHLASHYVSVVLP